jgi:hypothetical protein
VLLAFLSRIGQWRQAPIFSNRLTRDFRLVTRDYLLICFRPVIRCQHNYEFFGRVDGIKESVVSDTITPCLRGKINQLSNILAEVRLLTQLWIYIIQQFPADVRLPAGKLLLQIFLKLFGFKDGELSQAAYPGALWPQRAPDANGS